MAATEQPAAVPATEPTAAPGAAGVSGKPVADPERDAPRPSVDLGRIAWIAMTATLLVGMLVLALKRDWGYAGVTFAVAVSAAINLL